MSGDVRLNLPANTSARMHASTFSGALRSDIGQVSHSEHGPRLQAGHAHRQRRCQHQGGNLLRQPASTQRPVRPGRWQASPPTTDTGQTAKRRRAFKGAAAFSMLGARAAARLPSITDLGDTARKACATGPDPGHLPAPAPDPRITRSARRKTVDPATANARSPPDRYWSSADPAPAGCWTAPGSGCTMWPMMLPLMPPLSTPRLSDFAPSSPVPPSTLPGSRRIRPTLAPRSRPL